MCIATRWEGCQIKQRMESVIQRSAGANGVVDMRHSFIYIFRGGYGMQRAQLGAGSSDPDSLVRTAAVTSASIETLRFSYHASSLFPLSAHALYLDRYRKMHSLVYGLTCLAIIALPALSAPNGPYSTGCYTMAETTSGALQYTISSTLTTCIKKSTTTKISVSRCLA